MAQRPRKRPALGVEFAIAQKALDQHTTLVVVQGELDLASAPNLKWSLNDALSKGASRLIVDLTPVTFIDSTALGVLVGVRRALAPGACLAIVGADADEDVLNIFQLTGLDATFDMFSTLEQAFAWTRGSEATAG